MGSPGTFDRVYAAIKKRLRDGVYMPGERLEPGVLSYELSSSVTPVRDALHRLTGERLVEAPRHEGFRVPMINEATLRHLYTWHRDLLILAVLSRWVHEPKLEAQAEGNVTERGDRLAALFMKLAELGGNPEHVQALETIMDRRNPLQHLEDALLDAVEEETHQIAAALRGGDRRQLRRSLVNYHRRRERIVPEILERLYAR